MISTCDKTIATKVENAYHSMTLVDLPLGILLFFTPSSYGPDFW